MPNRTGARCPDHCLMAIMAGWHRYRTGERSTVALPDVAVPPHSAPPVVRGTATRAHPRHPKGEPDATDATDATDVTHACSSHEGAGGGHALLVCPLACRCPLPCRRGRGACRGPAAGTGCGRRHPRGDPSSPPACPGWLLPGPRAEVGLDCTAIS